MKGRQIVIDQIGGLEAAALLVNGQLDDFLLDTPDRPRPGAIYRAVCDRPMGGQGGMMVRLGDLTGYVRQGQDLSPGQVVLVQVTGYATEGKAIPVATKLSFKSRYAVLTPTAPGINLSRKITDEALRTRMLDMLDSAVTPGWGLVVRTVGATLSLPDLCDAVSQLNAAAEAVYASDDQGPVFLGDTPEVIARRDWDGVIEDSRFADLDVLEMLDDLRQPTIRLASGQMSIEPTRALVAVDIDTKGDTSPAAGLKANLAAMAALPRSLRLRGLGGQVTVDVAPTPKSQRGKVETALLKALKADPVATNLAGWTPLGHLELQRKRDRLPVLPRLAKVM